MKDYKIGVLWSIWVVASLTLLGLAWGTPAGVAAPLENRTRATRRPLDAAEIAGLEWMVEEEKLAHDVYIALYEIWGQKIFQNIADSETQHVEAVRNLLTAYGLADPSAGLSAGQFSEAELQTLYDSLMAQGNQSLIEALYVGATIEEIDILDLQQYLAQTDEARIQQVYTNLKDASGSHLRAFVRQIESRTGSTYEPQYLTAEEFAEIMGAS
jgi:hypothetical protein